MDAPANPTNENFASLIELERAARRAQSQMALGYVMVNETRRLIPYRQAVLLQTKGASVNIAALSDLPCVDRNTPYVQWLQKVATTVWKSEKGQRKHRVQPQHLKKAQSDDWAEHLPEQLLWVPLRTEKEPVRAVLMIAAEQPFHGGHAVLIDHLAETYGHAWRLFGAKPRRLLATRRTLWLTAALLVLLLLTTKVHLTALAPVEIVARQPFVVTAPIPGAVHEITVRTNDKIAPGHLLARLDDTEQRNQLALARKASEVAAEELARARRGAFADANSQALIAELSAQLKRHEAQVRYARERLSKTRLVADREGVAVTQSPEEWQGRPVAAGEAIMLIADPNRVQARIMLPVKDAVMLKDDARVRLFLDSDPLQPLEAKMERAEYTPELTPQGNYAYRLSARLQDEQKPLRIGLRGSAKLYGAKVNLAFFLFRRPITYFRQVTGW